jgi:alkyl sulfatase BDS1-like metallo-beta-lactamase superfamily hydrolase
MPLDWNDPTDHANATRGLVDKLEPCVVRDADGRVVYDGERWVFLDSDCPETVSPSLWRQSRLNAIHGLFEVAPGVYQVRGLDCANMTIVEGETGVLVLDTMTAEETAAAALALYRRNRGDRPVRGVVYSHSHTDHFGGAGGAVDPADAASGAVPVIAPEGFLEEAVSENVFAGPAMLRRGSWQAGMYLPDGPEAMVGFGIAQAAPFGTSGLIPPNTLVTRTGEELVVDGVRLVFQLTPGAEAPAELNVYLPDSRVLLVAENANHTLHNVQTLRGAPVRDAKAWAGYLTEAVQLFGAEAEVLIGSHNWPTFGREELVRQLCEQRDGYAYLHDQTVRLMNRGLNPLEIAEELAEFPGHLGELWHLRGYYGTLSHNVKAVYDRYMGWFDGNPANLWQLPPVEAGRRYVELAGGAEALLAHAQRCFEAGDYRWTAQLLNHLVFADSSNGEARELQARTFEKLGHGAESGIWRNFYLSGAQELRGTEVRISAGTGNGGLPTIRALKTGQLFELLAIQLDGPRAVDHRMVLRWEFTDTDETWTLVLANGVLTPLSGDAPGGEGPRLTVRLPREVMDLVLTRRTTFEAEVKAGSVVLVGDASALGELFGLLEAPRRKFPLTRR